MRRRRTTGGGIAPVIIILFSVIFAHAIIMLAGPIFGSYETTENIQQTQAYNGTSGIAASFTELTPMFIIIICIIGILTAFIFGYNKYAR